jgi:hypothetical protein
MYIANKSYAKMGNITLIENNNIFISYTSHERNCLFVVYSNVLALSLYLIIVNFYVFCGKFILWER